MAKQRQKQTRSEEAREKMRAAALVRGQRVAAEIRIRITTAMDTMAEEIKANQGIYPRNRGNVTLKEIAERADLSESVFYKKNYLDLAAAMRARLSAFKEETSARTKPSRKTPEERVGTWRNLYESLLESYRLAETDYRLANEQLYEAKEIIETLRLENSQLRSLLPAQRSDNVLKYSSKRVREGHKHGPSGNA